MTSLSLQSLGLQHINIHNNMVCSCMRVRVFFDVYNLVYTCMCRCVGMHVCSVY